VKHRLGVAPRVDNDLLPWTTCRHHHPRTGRYIPCPQCLGGRYTGRHRATLVYVGDTRNEGGGQWIDA
jgi:hypothetical protein